MSTEAGEPATVRILRGALTPEELAVLIGVLSRWVGCRAAGGSQATARAAWDRPAGAVVSGWRVPYRRMI